MSRLTYSLVPPQYETNSCSLWAGSVYNVLKMKEKSFTLMIYKTNSFEPLEKGFLVTYSLI